MGDLKADRLPLIVRGARQFGKTEAVRHFTASCYEHVVEINFVAEALSKSGCDLYYYRREDGSLEEDFFVRTADELLPVEVKAGNEVSKSLRSLIASDHYPAIRHGIKFARANIGKTETITTFPYFCAFLLKRYLKEQ